MQKGELTPVEINISGKTFPLRVTEEEASWIKNLEEEVNHKILEFQHAYPHNDKLDCVIMTLLTYAFENKQKSSVPAQPENDEKVGENLDDILRLLSVH
jgi:cell division protein ZapA